MTAQAWPTDPTFRRFAALIADGVMRAHANGFRIGGPGERQCCPEGAALMLRNIVDNLHPKAAAMQCVFGVQRGMAGEFAHGFDEWGPPTKPTMLEAAAYRLGQEYRRRFVESAQ